MFIRSGLLDEKLRHPSHLLLLSHSRNAHSYVGYYNTSQTLLSLFFSSFFLSFFLALALFWDGMARMDVKEEGSQMPE